MTDTSPLDRTERGLADSVRRSLGTLSPAERRVGRALLAAYPIAGLETVAKLAARAQVSGPTVIRFVNRLGFSGYPEFQQALRDDLDARDASPLALYDAATSHARSRTTGDGLLERASRAAVDATNRTFAGIAPHELDSAVRLLAESRRVLLAGGRYSHLLARYLQQHLEQFRPDVIMLPEVRPSQAAVATGLTSRDVVVVFDFRRYEPQATALAHEARRCKARVVLFTDAYLSPVAAQADVVLGADVTSVSPYDAMAPSLAVVEAVLAGILIELGDAAHERMKRIEAAAKRLDLY